MAASKRTAKTRPASGSRELVEDRVDDDRSEDDQAPEDRTDGTDAAPEESDRDGDVADGFDDEITPRRRSRTRAAEPARRRRGRDTTASRAASVRAVPEAAKDSAATETARARRSAEAERTRTTRRRVAAAAPNPAWLAPTAVVLLILGLLYLVVYYLTAGQLPFPIGDLNLLVGFGIMIVGGALLMRWK